jgi:benzoyl-CoA reductase/2-hydroxyglutaryl-CoA dehydratase subunit BcrC/BadD/HgdB
LIPKIDLNTIYNRLSEFKASGKKIIGAFSHTLIPDELIYAAGAIPIKLNLGGDDHLAAIGTEYLTQATCPFARGCIGCFDQANPIYTLFDAFIGGNFCNGDLCASEMISKFFKIPWLRITFPTTSRQFSLRFLRQEYLKLKGSLETLMGTQILAENLFSAFERYNNLRDALLSLNLQMKDQTSPLMGEDLHNLMHLVFLLGPDDALKFLNNAKLVAAEPSNNQIPVMLSGSGIALGDDLIHIIEELNARVTVNDTWTGIYFYNERLVYSPQDDPFDALANHYLLKNESARMVPNVRRVPRVLKLVKDYNIRGVINHVLKFCDPYVADRIRFKTALQAADIPVLELERDYATSLEQLKTRIGAFLEMLA